MNLRFSGPPHQFDVGQTSLPGSTGPNHIERTVEIASTLEQTCYPWKFPTKLGDLSNELTEPNSVHTLMKAPRRDVRLT